MRRYGPTPPLFGAGLVEAVPDTTFIDKSIQDDVRGRPSMATVPGRLRVASRAASCIGSWHWTKRGSSRTKIPWKPLSVVVVLPAFERDDGQAALGLLLGEDAAGPAWADDDAVDLLPPRHGHRVEPFRFDEAPQDSSKRREVLDAISAYGRRASARHRKMSTSVATQRI